MGFFRSFEQEGEGGERSLDEKKQRRESKTVGVTTLMNTKREISLPGFLHFHYPSQFRENHGISLLSFSSFSLQVYFIASCAKPKTKHN